MFHTRKDVSITQSSRRRVLGALLVTACALGLGQAQAADPVKIKFTLDWRFEGPSAPFLLAKSKGYFAAEGLDVEIDAGNGSAGAVTRVVTGAYDMGFADFNALVEYDAKTPGSKIQGIYMAYNSTPAAVFVLKKSGITKPADLAGKTLAAPIFDAGRKAWPAFAKANGLALDAVKWQTVEPAIRETLLARGDVDGITGFYFTSLLNLQARGVPADQIVALKYPDHGVEFYGNTLIASPKMLSEQPKAVEGFVRAFNKALKDTIADPDTAVLAVKERDPLINVALESQRLKLAINSVVITPETRSIGLGAVNPERLKRSVAEAATAFGLPATPDAGALFTSAYLPSAADRAIK
ncbi:MAG: taurine ABC transporter permease [Betaproteobacteria bacterium HGW-Betaproteobacteria-13]|jgi:NitT/TauT family transport system substrate-binding protein|uniref:Thiamine pyrimidine synthase n=1 Tax=Parazoarcus communis TaxID=41977 RepID=A0A2U8GYH2_9RHOO|nr:ABC transporter substrate-binding protein [Parazoarcus communis]AWI78769.1 taurine ABC transporter permease [Parazoarcus communis]PKO57390.1 MAG: taurine ABC transporter permease [Betaproteobacteria bacterium HGW-Betaproteobacteria-19]PKO79807.1 MAG: taurine ABC transporter permease [Betaproteobacteria bacterium HGW-Betaproteobacteria-13]